MTTPSDAPLPPGWTAAAIGDLVAGSVEQSGPDGDADFLYVDIGGVDNQTKRITDPKRLPVATAPSRARQRLLPADVLVSMTRPNLNAVAILPQDMHGAIGSTGFHVLRTGSVFPAWLFYIVQSTGFVDAMSRLVQGALYPAVRPKDINSHVIPIAPLPEQRRIVAAIETYFSRLDAAVTALKRVQANLKRYRASVLKAACEGRLVPTEAALAHAEGRPYEPASQLLTRILTERRAKWEADQLAKMHAAGKPPRDDRWKTQYQTPAPPKTDDLPASPEGWTWAAVEQAGEVRLGRQRSPAHRSERYPCAYLRAANITWDGLDLRDVLEMEFRPHERETYRLMPGDIVLSEASGSQDEAGKPAMWRGELAECCFQNTVIRFRPATVASDYALTLFQHYARNHVFTSVARGVGIHHIGAERFSGMPIPIPPLAEQHRIVVEVERLLSIADSLTQTMDASLQRAERLRQAILQRAFHGRLVSQDPNDEPASALLERIKAERTTGGPATNGAAANGNRRPGRQPRRNGPAAPPPIVWDRKAAAVPESVAPEASAQARLPGI